jgi:putative FmdB family regulatory protein
MPLFEYSCRNCAHRFERLSSVKSTETVICPNCQSEQVDRLLGLPGLGKVVDTSSVTQCSKDGPPCGASYCRRSSIGT